MTPEQAQREWERACERVGRDRNAEGTSWSPPLGDAACVVAMLEWLLPQGAFLYYQKTKKEWRIRDSRAVSHKTYTILAQEPTLPLALAAAVNSLP